MRLFVAIRLNDEMKDALCAAQDTMYRRGIRGNFTSEENMHLTLAFIGDYPEAEPVLDALSKVRFKPFELTLDELGCFGGLWWAGLQDSAPLNSLVRGVRRTLAEHEIPFDRKRFSAHITLLRRSSRPVSGLRLPPVCMTVEAVSLMRSDRGKHGMIYTELGTQDAE